MTVLLSSLPIHRNILWQARKGEERVAKDEYIVECNSAPVNASYYTFHKLITTLSVENRGPRPQQWNYWLACNTSRERGRWLLRPEQTLPFRSSGSIQNSIKKILTKQKIASDTKRPLSYCHASQAGRTSVIIQMILLRAFFENNSNGRRAILVARY